MTQFDPATLPDLTLNLYGQNLASITASGVTPDFYTGCAKTVLVSAYVKGAVSGTSPSAVFTVETLDALGNYISIGAGAAITSGPNFVLIPLGSGSAIPHGQRCRIRYTITGTNPVFNNVDVSAVGRM